MEDREKCEYSENGTCLYFEDSDLKCNGNNLDQDNCATYTEYRQL